MLLAKRRQQQRDNSMRLSIYVYIAFLIFTCYRSSFGQGRRVSFIKAIPNRSFNNTKDSVITYPIFFFKNKALTDKINKTVKVDFYKLFEKDKSLPIKTVLESLAKEGLAELSYEEITNDNQFFSFVIYHEWIAAYPSYYQVYYAFDKQSAKYLTIDSLVLPEKKKAFKELVIKLWKDSLVTYRKDLLTQLTESVIDSIDYAAALEYVQDDCVESFSPKDFRLSKDTLEVFFHCSFPRVMLPLDPSGGIVIPFKKIIEYLRPKYRP